jgi:hypothetical protein
MKKLTGVKIQKLDFLPIKQGDLLYHEGPLLSVFKDALSDNFYFYKWSDCDDKAHRWLVFKVSIQSIKSFFDKQLSLRQLILEQPFSYFLDLDNNLDPLSIVIVSSHTMPKSYLPEQGSFFDAEDFENYALFLQQKLKETGLQVA